MTSQVPIPGGAHQPPALKRSLATWGAVSMSLAAMGASLAANINPQGAAQTVGRAVPLTFVMATISVLLVAYGFARVCSRLSHSGSVFALTGVTIGPRAGLVAGWGLLGAYCAFSITTSMTAGIFGSSLLHSLGILSGEPGLTPWIIALATLGLSTLMAVNPVQRSMTALLWVELATIGLMLVIAVVIVVRVAIGDSPNDTSFTLDMFTVPSGTGTSTLFLGVVFGFLSFAGFEAAATLGEEAVEPKKAIPRAIFGVAALGGIFYVFVTAAEMLGFGTDAAGVRAFSESQSLFGTLGGQYIAGFVGDIVTAGSTVAAIGCCLATVIAASRLVFAMSRGALPNSSLQRVSATTGVPARAAVAVASVAATVVVLVRVAVTKDAFDLFAWSGTEGTLVLLVAYSLFTVGAWYYLCIRSARAGVRPRVLDYVVPVLALAVLLYTVYRNVIPWPDTTAGRLNVILPVCWILVAVAVVSLAPSVARRVGAELAAEEGLGSDETPIGQTGTLPVAEPAVVVERPEPPKVTL